MGGVLQYVWEAYFDTNGRRTAIQMGGALKCFPFLRAQWHRKHCNTNWRRIASRAIPGINANDRLKLNWTSGLE